MSTSDVVLVSTLGYGVFLCGAYPLVRGRVALPPVLLLLLALSPWSFGIFFAYTMFMRVGLLAAAPWYAAGGLPV